VKRAVVARHGESAYSAVGLLNGDVAAFVGLTPTGLDQARALGEALRDVPFDLCVTTELERVRLTADEAMRGRDVPRLVVPELNDPLYGPYEGGGIDAYRAWAHGASSSELPGDGGESRHAIVERYVRGFRIVLARPEETILVVAHSLPIAYLLGARDGSPPGARMPLVTYATPYELTAADIERAAAVLEAWVATPSW
jgi:broad specificity phosphatase PhoE